MGRVEISGWMGGSNGCCGRERKGESEGRRESK